MSIYNYLQSWFSTPEQQPPEKGTEIEEKYSDTSSEEETTEEVAKSVQDISEESLKKMSQFEKDFIAGSKQSSSFEREFRDIIKTDAGADIQTLKEKIEGLQAKISELKKDKNFTKLFSKTKREVKNLTKELEGLQTDLDFKKSIGGNF